MSRVRMGRARLQSCRRALKVVWALAPEEKGFRSKRVHQKLKSLPIFAFAIFLLLVPFAQTGRTATRVVSFSAYQQSSDSSSANTLSQQPARESREAASDDDQFKHSPSVQFVAKLTGLDLEHAYWVCVLLNFVVIAAAIFWLSKKNLPGLFRNRTASIQKAMEEARKASEDANRRLAEIETRLSKLDVEIGGMRAAAEKEAAAEEQRIKAAAVEDARKIVESAEQEIAAAAKSARRELTAYAADLAVTLAKKQIHVDAATDQALLRNFAQQLPTNGGETPKGRR
jgi:F-type H+-transporting ATPase subunit b